MAKKEVSIEHVLRRAVTSHKRIKSRQHRDVDDALDRLDSFKKVIIFFAILGILISVYMTWLHFKPGNSSFCSINEVFDCDAVNKSSYSQILGVPVALTGVAGYLAILITAISLMIGKNWSWLYRTWKPLHCELTLIALAAIGFAVSVYLTIVQAEFIGKWCIMCIASFITITVIFALTVTGYCLCKRWKKDMEGKGSDSKRLCKYC